MAIPAGITAITVTGTYLAPDGTPLSGYVVFTPSIKAADSTDNAIVPAVPYKVTLDEDGAFSEALMATDDPQWNDAGWTYQVQEVITTAQGTTKKTTYNIEVPAASAGGALDLADAAVVDLPGTPSQYLLKAGGTMTGTLNLVGGKAVPSGHVSITEYGAVGNDSTNNATAIQAAIDALPANGGVLVVPPGIFRVGSALTLRNGVTIQGDGIDVSILKQTSTSANLFTGSNVHDIAIRDIELQGPASGTGKGIAIAKGVGNHIAYLDFSNVYVTGFGSHGIDLENPIVSRFNGVKAEANGGWGFYLHGQNGGAAGTSTVLTDCYANANTTGGYWVFNMAYSNLIGCAADHNPVGYRLEDCIGTNMVGCGSEANDSGVEIDGGYGNAVKGMFVFANAGSGVHVLGNAACSLEGVVEVDPDGAATVMFDIDSGSKVWMAQCNNVTANSITSGTATVLDLNGFLALASGAYIPGTLGTEGNVSLFGGTLFIQNTSVPGTPSGGAVLYAEGGELKVKDASGNVTTLG
jgi:hypothetical protein